MSDTKFGAWSAPQTSLAIEYSLVAIEEIRQAVAEGFQRFARGGIEVGGVLYGTYEKGVVRILAVREIACEHARGPSFILSEGDRELLAEQWERDRDDPRLSGFSALGFYVSHTRSEVTLLPADVEFFNEFFPDPYHVALVVRPGRAGAMRAGFFVREADGSVKAETSYQDFSFPERLGGPSATRHPREQASLIEKRTTMPLGFTPSQVEPPPAPPPTEFAVPNFGGLGAAAPQSARAPEYMPVQPPPRRWGAWLAAILLIIAVAAGAFAYWRYFLPSTGPAEPLSLAAYQHESQLRIEWNHNASSVRDAGKGSLEITDGQTMQTIPLTPEDLARGSFTYTPTTGDVQVRMEIQSASRGNVVEQTRFLGAAPSGANATGDVQAIKQERDSLQEEVKKLRDQNAAQAERNRQLERTLTILRSRLGIVDADKK
jgi:hypothetical protein